MKEKSKLIALFGTSADPPTLGHYELLSGLSKIFPKVITWVSNNPFKKHRTSISMRVKLLQALVDEINIPNLNLKQEISSPWTIETLKGANQIWPDKEFIFIIGSDLTMQIKDWEKSSEILSNIQLGIVPRIGWPINELHIKYLQSLGALIQIIPLKIPATASSKIAKKNLLNEIPFGVSRIIIEEKLYNINS